MAENNGTGAALEKYFDAVDRRIIRLAGKDLHYDIRFDGKRLRMHFASEEDLKASLPSFSGALSEANGDPDAHLTYWRDDAAPYLPEGMGNKAGVWNANTEEAHLQIVPGVALRGADLVKNRFYICQLDGTDTPLFGDAHDMLKPLAMWAKHNGYMILHGASVGAGGDGVLISGKGGAGKSTLAVACLFAGLDFVSDDYFLAKKEGGTLYSMPLWRNIGLNPDSAALLNPPELPVVRTYAERGNKRFLDASSLMKTERLKAKALLLPEIAPVEKPVIEPFAAGPAVTRMVFSTARQLWINEPAEIARMTNAFSGLPAFKMLLCPDVYENARALAGFLQNGMRL